MTSPMTNPPPDLIPRHLLFGNPPRVVPQISADGRQLAFLAPYDGVLNLWVAPVDDLTQARPLTQDRGQGVRQYGWLRSGDALWYLQDQGGNENHHFFVVDGQGHSRDLTPFDGVQARLIGLSRRHPTQALVALNQRDRRWHDPYLLDLRDGRLTLLEENHGLTQYLCDDALRLRVALRHTADGGRELLVPEGVGTWRVLTSIPMDDVLGTQPLALGPVQDTVLYLLDSRGRDTAAVFALDLASGRQQLLGEHPHTDVLSLVLHPTRHRPEAFRTDHLTPQWTVLDPAVAADYAFLGEAAEGDFQLLDRSADDRWWVLAFSHDRRPGHYHLYDRQRRMLRFLFSARPALEDCTLAPRRTVQLSSRDGLTLVSYLSLPAGTPLDPQGRPQAPLPMVLLVHGGPWSRDHAGYSPDHQFLANRGYAVLSVNYRGSTGFGKAFVNAGNLEWGARMQQDLQDAVQWAVQAGVADPARVAIMGGSYGGYATLVGLSFTPTLFACGVDLVGPSNLETLLACFPPYWAPLLENFARRVGDPRTEAGRALLRARSPLHRADDICRPLLIAQGANDVRVTRAESDQLVAALQRRGQPVGYLLYADEGHGLARPENKRSFMALVERFLARHLGGRCEPAGDDLQAGSLQILAGVDWLDPQA